MHLRQAAASFIIFGAALCWTGGVSAEEMVVQLTIRNHKFDPPELAVPARQKVKLVIENMDPTPEEFESYELNREKVVPARTSTVVFVGPLQPGRYPFFGDFNRDSAQGVLIAN